MSTDAEGQASAWHDEKHGSGEPAWSCCWCCCTLCDPDYNPETPNPYFETAQASWAALDSAE